jgi:hypothetical protein
VTGYNRGLTTTRERLPRKEQPVWSCSQGPKHGGSTTSGIYSRATSQYISKGVDRRDRQVEAPRLGLWFASQRQARHCFVKSFQFQSQFAKHSVFLPSHPLHLGISHPVLATSSSAMPPRRPWPETIRCSCENACRIAS